MSDFLVCKRGSVELILFSKEDCEYEIKGSKQIASQRIGLFMIAFLFSEDDKNVKLFYRY